MTSIDPLSIIDREAARFAGVLVGLAPETPAPTTPGWTAADLLWHLSEVHLFWSAILTTGALTDEQSEQIEQDKPERPATMAELAQLRAGATAELVAALAARQDDEPAWSWFEPDQSVGFTRRMQLHEATIHRVDAELTADQPVGPISAEVARDGIDHVLDVMWAWPPADKQEQVLGVVDLDEVDDHGQRTGHSWPIEVFSWTGVAPWGQQFTDRLAGRRARPGVVADARLAATAAQLDLLLWGRPATVQRFGDQDLLGRFDEVVQTGII